MSNELLNCPSTSHTTALRRFWGYQGSGAGFRRDSQAINGLLTRLRGLEGVTLRNPL